MSIIYKKVCNVPLLHHQLLQVGFRGAVSSDNQSWTEAIPSAENTASLEAVNSVFMAHDPNEPMPPQPIDTEQARRALAKALGMTVEQMEAVLASVGSGGGLLS